VKADEHTHRRAPTPPRPPTPRAAGAAGRVLVHMAPLMSSASSTTAAPAQSTPVNGSGSSQAMKHPLNAATANAALQNTGTATSPAVVSPAATPSSHRRRRRPSTAPDRSVLAPCDPLQREVTHCSSAPPSSQRGHHSTRDRSTPRATVGSGLVIPAGDERTPDGGERAPELPTREQIMTIRSVDQDDAIILIVDGEVDGLTSPRLRAAVSDAFENLHGRLLVIDLSDVEFLGSQGLRVLTDSAAEVVQHHGFEPLRIVVDDTRPVIRPIEIIGLDNVLTLYYSIKDALAA
jgi:anti-sigma B factor antagonist